MDNLVSMQMAIFPDNSNNYQMCYEFKMFFDGAPDDLEYILKNFNITDVTRGNPGDTSILNDRAKK